MKEVKREYISPENYTFQMILAGGYLASWHFYDRYSGKILFEITHPDYKNPTYNFMHHFLPFDLEIIPWLSKLSDFGEMPHAFKYTLLKYIFALIPDAIPRTSRQELEDLLR